MTNQAQVRCVNCGTLNSVNEIVCTGCNQIIDPTAPIVGGATGGLLLSVLDPNGWTEAGPMFDVITAPGLYYLGRSFTDSMTGDRVHPDIDVRYAAKVVNGGVAISKRHLAIRITDTGAMFSRYEADSAEPVYGNAVAVSFGEIISNTFVATINDCPLGQEYALTPGVVIWLGNPLSTERPGMALLVKAK